MNFNTKNAKVDSGFKTPQFIQMGPNELKITALEAVLSKNGDKFKVQVSFETKPMKLPFEGWEGAIGQIGKTDLSIYLPIQEEGIPLTEQQNRAQQDFLDRIATIAVAMGVAAQLDAIEASDIDTYLAKVTKVFSNKYAWFLIGGEEYEGTDKDGNPKIKEVIKIPRYNYVAATESELLGKQKDKAWPNKTNKYFFKPLLGMDADSKSNAKPSATQNPDLDLPLF